MRVLVVSPHYKPEEVAAAATFVQEIAVDLTAMGHDVSVLTAFPNYPTGKIFEPYRGKVFQRENYSGIPLTRVWIYATASKRFWPRLLNFGSFSVTALLGGLVTRPRPDALYVMMPPLTLGITGVLLGIARRARVVINVQDIHPYAAVATGVLKNKRAIRFFEWLEKWIYRHVDHIVVISRGFRDNLIEKGTPPDKISVVSNWADPDFITPGPRENSFRQQLGADGRFTLVYSGGLTHNSNLEPVLGAADLLRDEPFEFVIVGDGVRKADLQVMAAEKHLDNVRFLPFQPLERFPDVLRAADMNLVTLSAQAALVSVPSKIFKQMAAGRPILAITAHDTEIERLVSDANCGLTVEPDDPSGLAEALRWAADHPEECARQGVQARQYFEQYHSRALCVKQLEAILQQTIAHSH
ncbi:glycosyltransferase family 4 protein [Aggregatilinea lenta]|uniref:glycosyltransferase family 4 protein n=1 Tax=Aggregatilinea lenta TaxID=913108 RepID=UPI000E5BED6D|nr:glycosyltransferase family 4 protein [Aggregatilinea lenta]